MRLTKCMKRLISIQKILLIMFYTLPLSLIKISYLILYDELQLNNRNELPYYSIGLKVKLCALGIFATEFIYLSIKYLQSKKSSKGLAVQGNHNFLCKFSIIIFLVYSVIIVFDYFSSEQADTFSVYGTRALFNVYIYMITYLYLPIESSL